MNYYLLNLYTGITSSLLCRNFGLVKLRNETKREKIKDFEQLGCCLLLTQCLLRV